MAEDGIDEGYGLSPARWLQVELRLRPTVVAVLVEVAFVVLVGNQWMLDHAVQPWLRDPSPIRRGLAAAIGSFAWSITPDGYGWLFVAGIAHALVWFVLTYLLVRACVRVTETGPRIVATIGSIVVAAVLALVVERILGYPDIQKVVERSGTQLPGGAAGPGFVEWSLFGTVAGRGPGRRRHRRSRGDGHRTVRAACRRPGPGLDEATRRDERRSRRRG